MTTYPHRLLTTMGVGLARVGNVPGAGNGWTYLRGTVVLAALVAILAGRSTAGELPFTVEWTTVPELTVTGLSPNSSSYGCVLADGRVLYAEFLADYSQQVLLFDPQTNAWTRKAAVPDGKRMTCMVALADGRVFMIGRTIPDTFYATYLYNPDADTFSRKSNLALHPTGDQGFAAQSGTQLPNGELYVFGAFALNQSSYPGYLYNPDTDGWRVGPASGDQISNGLPLPAGFWGYAADRVTIFDAETMQWRGIVAPQGFTSASRPACLVEGQVCWSVGTANYDENLLAHDLSADTFSAIGSVSNTLSAKNGVFSASAGGRDWLFHAFTRPFNDSDYGLFNLQVFDPNGGAWTSLAGGPVRIFANTAANDSRNFAYYSQLNDGFLMLGYNADTRLLKGQRLRVIYNGHPVPAAVDPDILPVTLNLDEDTSQTVAYKVIGDLPPGGVDVAVERVSGSAYVAVVDGSLQRVVSRSDFKTVRIAALKDADSLDDQAVIRLRVVQPGGAADPNARLIPVHVRDRYHQDNQPPAIVSAAWANPNPVTLPAASTVAVVAGDPDGDPLTYTWTTVSGPAAVSFAPNGTAASASSSATFGAAGTYVLRVTVGDGKGGSATSDVTVVTNPGSGVDPRADVNHDGVVNALDLQIVIANFGQTVP